MDNMMLYIIAVLIIVLLVAVLLRQKNKAQRPAVQSSVKTARKTTPAVPLAPSGADKRAAGSENTFDDLVVAQRFMDQQRYDKAIETLKRGLVQKPNDSQLSLKLLSVYATINQPEDFYKVYDAIKIHGDSESIRKADELKALLAEEQDQMALRGVPADDSKNDNFESIDFDLPPSQSGNKGSNQNTAFETAATENTPSSDMLTLADSNKIHTGTENADDHFNLTLGDLESSTTEPVFELETAEDNIGAALSTNALTALEDTDDNDFNFDFDGPEQSNSLTEVPEESATANSRLEETLLDDNDFVLDFADLSTDADIDENTFGAVNKAAVDTAAQSHEYDFTLSLDSTDDLDIAAEKDIPVVVENRDTDNSVEGFGVSPTMLAMFDDNTGIDDDFEATLSLPTATTPVVVAEGYIEESYKEASNEIDAETAADFSSRFAADFDFVKTLDSNQVTLDLAGQYLQLGEYDSAKRLLNEVVTQGNSAQQNQAQLLLERTT